MQILFISRWFPYPADNGSKLRVYNLLQGLSEYHQVTLLSFVEDPIAENDLSELNSFCQKIQTVSWKPYDPQSRRARLGFLSLTPRSLVDTFSIEMKHCIDKNLVEHQYDLVIASQIGAARYGLNNFQETRALFEEVELSVLYEKYTRADSIPSRIRHGLTWAKQRRYMVQLLPFYDACTVVSEQEQHLLNQVVPNYQAVEVIPNCVNLFDYKDVDLNKVPPSSLVFTGSFRYFANYDAMTWFLQEVFPLVRAQVPETYLTITGDHDDLPLPNHDDHVKLSGFVKDVRPLIASSWISLAPIHLGGGTRLKILEAMALHTPVVATSKGAEGLEVQSGQHILIADTPQSFAKEIIRLMKDSDLRDQLAENAYQLVKEKYDWASVLPRFLTLVETVAFNQKVGFEA